MKIIVVGGGFAGVKLALELANKPGFDITLVSQGPNFEYHGALYRSGTGRSPLEVVLPLRDIFKKAKNVELVLDRIADIDVLKQRVVSETGNVYGYDKVIFAMGNVLNYFGIKGLSAYSHSLDTIANTIRLRHVLTELFKASGQPVIAVIGAGASGVELAGELQHFAGLVAERYRADEAKATVKLVEASSRVLPSLEPLASEKALKRLKKLGIDVQLNTKVVSCEDGILVLDSGDLKVDLIVWTAGSKAVEFYHERPEIFQIENGRVKVDKYLQASGQTDIYVLGDNAATPYSGMAQTALHDAKFLARNLIRERAGKDLASYAVRRPIYAIPIGPRWAILQTPKRIISGYKGWLVRRRADLAIYRNFEPYKQAIKIWRKGNKLARF